MTMEVDGTGQRGYSKKTRYDNVSEDIEFRPVPKSIAPVRKKWRRGQLSNPGLPGKIPFKMHVLCVD